MLSFYPCTFYLSFSLSRRDSSPGSPNRLLSPLPATVRAFIFYREKARAVYPLVDSHRIGIMTLACVLCYIIILNTSSVSSSISLGSLLIFSGRVVHQPLIFTDVLFVEYIIKIKNTPAVNIYYKKNIYILYIYYLYYSYRCCRTNSVHCYYLCHT